MKRFVGAFCFSLVLVCLLFNLAAAEDDEPPVRQKNPAVARGLALIPIAGPLAAGRYVGDAGIPDELKATAWIVSAVDVAVIGLSTFYCYQVGFLNEDTNGDGVEDDKDMDEEKRRMADLGIGVGIGVFTSVVYNALWSDVFSDYCKKYNRQHRPRPHFSLNEDGTTTMALQFRF